MEFRMKVTKLELDGDRTQAHLDRIDNGKKQSWTWAVINVTGVEDQFPLGSELYVEIVPVPKLQVVSAKEIPAPAPA